MPDDLSGLREQVSRLRTAAAKALDEAREGPLRDLLRTIDEQVAAAAAAVERLYDDAFVSTRLDGLHRGTVVAGEDPDGRGRLLVSVPAAGDEPRWAMTSLPLTGAADVVHPAPGEAVWVMFEGGDPAAPVAIGICPV